MKSKIVALLIWTLFVSTLVLAQEVAAPAAASAAPAMPLVETDTESGAQIYLLGGDERDANTIYGEEPYGDSTGRWIVIRYLNKNKKGDKGPGPCVIDLTDGSRREIAYGGVVGHAWGEYIYSQETVEGKRMLRRYHFETLKAEDVAPIPAEMGPAYGATVSPDRRYFAICGRYAASSDKKAPAGTKVHLLDLKSGKWSLLFDKPGYNAVHEQFSRDGRNRVMVQYNPHGKGHVLLAELEIGGKEKLFPAAPPYTLPLTGHEAWIGTSDRICFTTVIEGDTSGWSTEAPIGKIWSAKVGEDKATLIADVPGWLYHVSISRCGRYWIADNIGRAEGLPICIGSFASGKWKRAVCAHPVNAPETRDHTHPYMTADNKWLIFTSMQAGHPQVYGAKLAEGWLAGL